MFGTTPARVRLILLVATTVAAMATIGTAAAAMGSGPATRCQPLNPYLHPAVCETRARPKIKTRALTPPTVKALSRCHRWNPYLDVAVCVALRHKLHTVKTNAAQRPAQLHYSACNPYAPVVARCR